MPVSVKLVWLTLTNEQQTDVIRKEALQEATEKVQEFISMRETDGTSSVEKDMRYFTTTIVRKFKTIKSAKEFADFMNAYAIKYGYTLISASIE